MEYEKSTSFSFIFLHKWVFSSNYLMNRVYAMCIIQQQAYLRDSFSCKQFTDNNPAINGKWEMALLRQFYPIYSHSLSKSAVKWPFSIYPTHLNEITHLRFAMKRFNLNYLICHLIYFDEFGRFFLGLI